MGCLLILSALVGLSVVLVSAVSFARSSRYRPAEVSLLAFSFQVSVGVGMVACGGGNANGGGGGTPTPGSYTVNPYRYLFVQLRGDQAQHKRYARGEIRFLCWLEMCWLGDIPSR